MHIFRAAEFRSWHFSKMYKFSVHLHSDFHRWIPVRLFPPKVSSAQVTALCGGSLLCLTYFRQPAVAASGLEQAKIEFVSLNFCLEWEELSLNLWEFRLLMLQIIWIIPCNLLFLQTNEDISEVKRDRGLSEEDIENRERWKLVWGTIKVKNPRKW